MIYSSWTRMLRTHPWTCLPRSWTFHPCNLGRIPGNTSPIRVPDTRRPRSSTTERQKRCYEVFKTYGLLQLDHHS
eukprot:7848920-Prorocentrum_lima.AAC.1